MWYKPPRQCFSSAFSWQKQPGLSTFNTFPALIFPSRRILSFSNSILSSSCSSVLPDHCILCCAYSTIMAERLLAALEPIAFSAALTLPLHSPSENPSRGFFVRSYRRLPDHTGSQEQLHPPRGLTLPACCAKRHLP